MLFTASFVADDCTVESLVSHVHALLCDTVLLHDCAEVRRRVAACGAQWRRRVACSGGGGVRRAVAAA